MNKTAWYVLDKLSTEEIDLVYDKIGKIKLEGVCKVFIQQSLIENIAKVDIGAFNTAISTLLSETFKLSVPEAMTMLSCYVIQMLSANLLMGLVDPLEGNPEDVRKEMLNFVLAAIIEKIEHKPNP